MMTKKRIDFVDHLRGLALIGVVWFHTEHPAFLDFSFRIPLFFLISGIFFRPYPLKTFVKKKVDQLLIPTLFFYLVYFLWYLGLYAAKYHSISGFNWSCLWEVFGLYHGTGGFTINPPLWFIFALLWLQVISWVLLKLWNNKVFFFLVALGVTVAGCLGLYEVDTPLMLSRSTIYFIYFALGYVAGTELLHVVDAGRGAAFWGLLAGAAVVFGVSIYVVYGLGYTNVMNPVYYVAVIALVVLLMYLMKATHRMLIMQPFNFFGQNTFVLLGLHEMILTMMLIGVQHVLGENTIWLGIAQVVATLLIVWPITLWCNRRIPRLVGK